MVLLPIAILSLVGAAGVVQAKRSKKITDPRILAERKVIYETALNTVKDPAKLRAMADAYRKEGMTAEANMLLKRAALQELPQETKDARRDVFRKAMASTDPQKILQVAEAFESQGATGAAENLRTYAAGLTVAEVKADE